jgi:DNA-binding MarR family transcriptional regulator
MSDHIEETMEAWARERPDLDTGPIALLARVSRLARHLEQAQQEGFDALGLKPGWLDTLAALRRAGPPYRLSPTELCAEALLSSGGMTSRIDRLEEAGLVRRKADADDRRGVIVELTAEGRRITDAAIDDHSDVAGHLVSPLAREEQEALVHMLRELLAALEHPDSPREETEARPQPGASWIPRRGAGASPRDSARRGRRPRGEQRGPSR